jgi:hypothetical protein
MLSRARASNASRSPGEHRARLVLIVLIENPLHLSTSKVADGPASQRPSTTLILRPPRAVVQGGSRQKRWLTPVLRTLDVPGSCSDGCELDSGLRSATVQVYAASGRPPAAAARNVLGEAVPRSIPYPTPSTPSASEVAPGRTIDGRPNGGQGSEGRHRRGEPLHRAPSAADRTDRRPLPPSRFSIECSMRTTTTRRPSALSTSCASRDLSRTSLWEREMPALGLPYRARILTVTVLCSPGSHRTAPVPSDSGHVALAANIGR